MYENYPENFTFQFGDGSLAVDGLWQIIEDGRVLLTSRDHAQSFGLPEPIDASREASRMLQGLAVVEVRLRESSSDLNIEFDGGRWLEVLTDTSGLNRGTFGLQAFTWWRAAAVQLPTSRGRPDRPL